MSESVRKAAREAFGIDMTERKPLQIPTLASVGARVQDVRFAWPQGGGYLGQIQDPYTYVTLTRAEFAAAARRILRDYEHRQGKRAAKMKELKAFLYEAVSGEDGATASRTYLVMGDPEQLNYELGNLERLTKAYREHLADPMPRDIEAVEKTLLRLHGHAVESMTILGEFLGKEDEK